MQGNYLNLTVFNELLYATATGTAGQVKAKRTPNSRKDCTHTHQVCLEVSNISKKYKENENIEQLEQNIKMKLHSTHQS